MCAGGDQRRRVGERWPIWLLSAWSFIVNLALFAFLIYITVKVTEFRPTPLPTKLEERPLEEEKDRDDAAFVRVVAYIVSIILLGEIVAHVLLVTALLFEKALKKACNFIAGYMIYEIIMLITLCTVLIFDVMSLLHPKSTAEKVIIALFIIASLVRRGLSLILYTKYYSYVKFGGGPLDASLAAVVSARPLGEVDYIDDQPGKRSPAQKPVTEHPKQTAHKEYVPFTISSHYISHDFYDGRL